jgi:hypothetical protein
MGIKVNIKKNFVVNGKTFNSLEEMPDNLREAFASGSLRQSPGIKFNTYTKITFNGQEYESIDAMPPDVQDLYKKVMQSLAAGQTDELAGLIAPEGQASLPGSFKPIPYENPNVIKTASAFPTWLIIIIILIAVILYYFVFHGK